MITRAERHATWNQERLPFANIAFFQKEFFIAIDAEFSGNAKRVSNGGGRRLPALRIEGPDTPAEGSLQFFC